MANETTKRVTAKNTTQTFPQANKQSDISIDELIRALLDKRENRRAQTVWQWETVRRNIPGFTKKPL